MGNAPSSSNKKNFLSGLENLVTRLIMKQSWKDMQLLEQPQHCEKLIAIGTEVLNKHLNSRQIKHLADRVKNGNERPEILEKTSSEYSIFNIENNK